MMDASELQAMLQGFGLAPAAAKIEGDLFVCLLVCACLLVLGWMVLFLQLLLLLCGYLSLFYEQNWFSMLACFECCLPIRQGW